MECRATACPPYHYGFYNIPPVSMGLCEDSPYNEKSVELPVRSTDYGEKVCGSIIDVDSLTIGESIPINGLGYTLNYFSHLSRGRNYKLDAEITGSDPASNTTEFHVKVESGSWTVVPEFITPNQSNLTYSFQWNGKNENDEWVWGPKKFNIISKQIFSSGNDEIIPSVFEATLGTFNADLLGLGGWLPSIYKFYSALTEEVYDGEGNIRKADAKVLVGDPSGAKYMIGNVGNTEVYFFDEVGRILFIKTPLTGSIKYSFNYNGNGRLISIQEPFGRTTSFERDSNEKFLRIIAPNGVYSPSRKEASSLNLSAASLVTLVELDGNDRIFKVKNFSDPTFVYEMSYYTNGLLKTFKKPGGQLSTFSYNSIGELQKDEHSSGYFLEFLRTLNSSGQKVVEATDNSNHKTTYTFGTAYYYEFARTAHHPSGVREVFSRGLDSSNARMIGNSGSSIYYDHDGRIYGAKNIRTENYGGNGVNYSHFYGYPTIVLQDWEDPFSIVSITRTGNINSSKIYSSVYDGPTRTYIFETAGSSKTETLQLDEYERAIRVQKGNLTATEYEYTNEFLTKIKKGLRETTLSYNASTGFLESIVNSLGQVVSFTYNSLGRLSTVVLPGARTVRYSYDLNGNLVSLTNPLNIMHSFAFNANEQISSYAPPGGIGFTTSYEYTPNKILKKINKPDGSALNYNLQVGTGVLSSISTMDGDYVFTRESEMQLPTRIKSPDGSSLEIGYAKPVITNIVWKNHLDVNLASYERYFSMTSVSSDSVGGLNPYLKSTISYAYDSDINLIQAGDLFLTYNQNDQLVGTELGSGLNKIEDEYAYSAIGELVSYTAKKGGVPIYSLSLDRDIGGRVTKKSDTINAQSSEIDIVYDSSGRLYQIKNGSLVKSQYEYDLNGNRIGGFVGGRGISATHDTQDRILTYGSDIFSYTANGELLQRENSLGTFTRTYSYNSLGQLRQVQLPTKNIEYEIDGLGRRVSRSVNGSLVERYVYKDDIRITAVIDPLGNISQRFVYASKYNVPDYMIMAGETYRLISDDLGSVRLVVKLSDGSISQRIDYDEFGKVLRDTNTCFQPFGFAGGLRDRDTGLIRFGARDYDPEIGRWTSKDPILFGGGDTNLYGYTFSDPINFIDPSGLAVGDWWDLPANFGRAREIANEEHVKWAGNHNNWGDAMRHYEWSRRTTAETNSFTAFTAGWAHEIEYFFRRGRMPLGQYLRESWMDVNNNSLGRSSGRSRNLMCPSNLSTQPGTGY